MGLITVAVAACWAILLGIAFLARVVLRWSRPRAALAVLVGYGACACAAVGWLGFRSAGLLGAAGLLLPCAVALVAATAQPPGRRR